MLKNFGKEGDYLIKVEQKDTNKNDLIPQIKNQLIQGLNSDVNFRRVENVGPKVSAELLESSINCYITSFILICFFISG